MQKSSNLEKRGGRGSSGPQKGLPLPPFGLVLKKAGEKKKGWEVQGEESGGIRG